jgi:5-formyltetrahydrofolate cyclo-ligase
MAVCAGFVDKPALRAEIRNRLAALRPLMRAQEEELVNAAIVSDPDWVEAETILVYKAVAPELSVVSATNDAFRRGVRVCFPRVGPGGLSLHEVAGWHELEPGKYGIPAPSESAPVVSPATIDIAVVPGVAWAPGGMRLGQGGGYYDRLLPALGGISWGVGFDCQLVEAIPTESHDRPVDRVIAPSKLGE